jgi:hypothetical protein
MISFKDLLEYCQVEAIASKVSPTEDSVWRGLCRQYSKKFHTPLNQVLEMDPEHVILNVYEDQAEEMETEDYQKLEHIMDMIRTIEDPNYEAQKQNEQDEFDRQAEEEEAARVAAGKAVHPSLQRKLNQKMAEDKAKKEGEEAPKEPPKQGFIDLSYLAKQDSEG